MKELRNLSAEEYLKQVYGESDISKITLSGEELIGIMTEYAIFKTKHFVSNYPLDIIE